MKTPNAALIFRPGGHSAKNARRAGAANTQPSGDNLMSEVWPLPPRDGKAPAADEPIGSTLDGAGGTAFVITSFGYLHPGGIPEAHITLDVRRLLRNPHHDPAMRELTGLDRAVRDHVGATPGARDVLTGLFTAAAGMYAVLNPHSQITFIAIGCAGGRHRSVVLANDLGHRLHRESGRTVDIVHRDLMRPVMQTHDD